MRVSVHSVFGTLVQFSSISPSLTAACSDFVKLLIGQAYTVHVLHLIRFGAMAVLVALSLFAFVAADCLGDPSDCLGDPMNLIQTPRRSLTAQDIINKHFHGIPQGGSFVRKNLVAMNQNYEKEIAAEKEKKTAAWACSTIDFSSFVGSGADNPAVRAIMDTLHITERQGMLSVVVGCRTPVTN